MKKVYIFAGLAGLLVFLYLIAIQFINGEWTKSEQRLAAVAFVFMLPFLAFKIYKSFKEK